MMRKNLKFGIVQYFISWSDNEPIHDVHEMFLFRRDFFLEESFFILYQKEQLLPRVEIL